jgi:hypothetical protein
VQQIQPGGWRFHKSWCLCRACGGTCLQSLCFSSHCVQTATVMSHFAHPEQHDALRAATSSALPHRHASSGLLPPCPVPTV